MFRNVHGGTPSEVRASMITAKAAEKVIPAGRRNLGVDHILSSHVKPYLPPCRNQKYHDSIMNLHLFGPNSSVHFGTRTRADINAFQINLAFLCFSTPASSDGKVENGWKWGDSDGFGEFLRPLALRNPSHSTGLTLPGRKTQPSVMAWVSCQVEMR